jgi:hypothetical protein
MAKAIATPVPGEMSLAAGLDLARVGLGAISRAPLLSGGCRTFGPWPSHGKGLTVFYR